MASSLTSRRLVEIYGATYDGAIDLPALRRAHCPRFSERVSMFAEGNTAAALPFLQWWRCPVVAGTLTAPSNEWLDYLSAQVASGFFDTEVRGRTVRTKRVKELEAEQAVADYLMGVAASCRGLITGTATGELDRMAESLRSLGASGLGNLVVVNACRSAAGFPSCLEGDPSDVLAQRDSGFIQVACRGSQQIYDTLLQLPAVGMHPGVLTPTMPFYYGVKDGHRASGLLVEPDLEVNLFLDEVLALGMGAARPQHADFLERALDEHMVPPGLLDGDTAMGNCVTGDLYQGFKVEQKARAQRALEIVPQVARLFEQRFGRRGLELFEGHGLSDRPEMALVAMGPDAGTAISLLPGLREELGLRVGLVVVRMLSPFPSRELAEALRGVGAVGVVNNAHHQGRGHLTLDVQDALREDGRAVPVEAFFCGLGGADVSDATWKAMARITANAADRGRISQRWHWMHEGAEWME